MAKADNSNSKPSRVGCFIAAFLLVVLGVTIMVLSFLFKEPWIGVAWALASGVLLFGIYMLIDCLKGNRTDKTAWVIVLVFLPILGAVLYAFIAYQRPENP